VLTAGADDIFGIGDHEVAVSAAADDVGLPVTPQLIIELLSR